MPPDVPVERFATSRTSFDATLRDADMIADAKKKTLPLEPLGWEELTKVTARVIATPKEAAQLAK